MTNLRFVEDMINVINNIIKPLYDPSQLSTKPTCPSKFKKDSKRTDKSKMDLANKMAFIVKEILKHALLLALSSARSMRPSLSASNQICPPFSASLRPREYRDGYYRKPS